MVRLTPLKQKYRPSNFGFLLTPNERYLPEDTDFLIGAQSQVLIGDLNTSCIEWNSRINKQRGTRLLEDTHVIDTVIIGPEEPTRLAI